MEQNLNRPKKSQIAIEFAYRTRDRHPDAWVFWVHASDAARFKEAYRAIALKLHLPGRDNPTVDVMQLVYDWLCNEKSGPWLMILDNADDPSIFTQQYRQSTVAATAASHQSGQLARYLPDTASGSILVTSRFDPAGIALVGTRGLLVKVDCMSQESSTQLLKAKLAYDKLDEATESKVAELVELLGGVPLAISHAAAYIDNKQRMSITKYVDRFKANEESQASLLSFNNNDLRRDAGVSNSVIVTWQLSFEQISEVQHDSVEILFLMSMLDKDEIPETIIRDEMTESEFDNAIEPLLEYSLITEAVAAKTFTMHWLVQLATRTWLRQRDELQHWQLKSIMRVIDHFPGGRSEAIPESDIWLPHARLVVTYLPNVSDPAVRLAQAQLNRRMACLAYHKCDSSSAQRFAQKSSDPCRELLGPSHLWTRDTLFLIAMIHTDMDRLDAAERMAEEILAYETSILGLNHERILDRKAFLAGVYFLQGHHLEAEKLFLEIIDHCEKFSKPDPGSVSSYKLPLANCIMCQGRLEEAVKLYLRVVEERKQILGEDHLDTLIPMISLADAYERLDRWNSVEEVLVQVNSKLKKFHPYQIREIRQTIARLAIATSSYRNGLKLKR